MPVSRCQPSMSSWSVTCAGDRAEVLALCIALELHPDASFERPPEQHGKGTPDWILRLPGGRSAAMEVTSKRDVLRYEDLDVDGVTVRAGFNVKSWTDGDTDDLYRTLTRKMQDKAEQGQLQSVEADEKWLCIQLDLDAGSELETLLGPRETLTVEMPSCRVIAVNDLPTPMPCLGGLMAQVRKFGYDEVWAFSSAALAQGRTLVLRVRATAGRWEGFHMLADWSFEQGGVAQRASPPVVTGASSG